MKLPGQERILVVDDSPATVEVLERNLAARGHAVLTVSSMAEAVASLAASPVDLVITDLKMPGGSGLDLIRHVRERYPSTEVMMITGYATVESAVEAMRGGADEYLAKPFTADELQAAVERVLSKLRSRAAVPGPAADPGLAGRSQALIRVRDQVLRAAHSANPVLILGEAGTGRQRVARAIHYASPRADRPFVVVDCARIPAPWFEREVLGPGGLLEATHGGTLFLAEVHGLAPDAQGRLARALADLHDVRVMASGPSDLAARGTSRRFRPELLARLEATRIDLPPLRERKEDVAPLAGHFLERLAAPQGLPAPRIDEEALRLLERHEWPGNVAELESLLSRFAGERLTVEDLPAFLRPAPAAAADLSRPLAAWELDHIRAVLDAVGGNKTRAAGILGIDRKTLRQKLR